ncbi:MAG: recombination regulator RecX [Gammaproteobacteria bacterium]|nr:recombination regulator RecX [Gammaproteobacteria bacterium]
MSRSINEVAIAALSRREHSVLEIRRKLKLKNFEEDEIGICIEKLINNNLLSEERFTESYINMRKRRGYGPGRIAQELRERGVDESLFADYLDKNNPDWQRVMLRQYCKKYGNKQAADYAEKVKRAKHLQSRGFPLDWVFKLDSMSLDEY